jgi:hypothetical protein
MYRMEHSGIAPATIVGERMDSGTNGKAVSISTDGGSSGEQDVIRKNDGDKLTESSRIKTVHSRGMWIGEEAAVKVLLADAGVLAMAQELRTKLAH